MLDEKDLGLQIDDPDAVRAEWLDRLHALASQVKGWVEKLDWRTRLVSKPVRDGVLGRFEVPLLLMEKVGVQIALNPVSPFESGSSGCVDLYVVPAYDEVAGLYYETGVWTLYYVFQEEGPRDHRREAEALPFSEDSLIRVLDAMVLRGE